MATTVEMILRTIADLGGVNAVSDAVGRLQDRTERLSKGMAIAGGALTAMGGAGIAAAAGTVRAYANLQEQQYSVTKNLDLSAEAQAEFNEQMREADLISGTTSAQFYEVAAAYSSAGVAQEELVELTTLSAQAQSALDLSTQQVTIAVNEARDGFGLAGDELESYLQSANLLSNSSSANAQNLIEMSGRTAALAGTLGFTADQNLALNTVFAEAAPSAETAASAQVRMISVLGNLTNASGDAKQAIADMGLNVEDFTALFQQDAIKAISLFNEELMSEAPSERLRLMSELFGNEMSYNSAILKAAANTQKLNEYNRLTNDSGAKQSSWMAETSGAAGNLNAKLQKLQETFTYTSASIGSALAPALSGAVDQLTNFLTKVSEFAEGNQGLVQALAAISVAAVAIGGGLIAAGVAVGLFSTAAAGLGSILLGGSLALSFFAAAIGAVSLPVVAAVVAIAGLAAAAYTLVTNWSSVSAWFSSMWASLSAAVSGAIAGIRGNLVGFAAYLPGWGGIIGNVVAAAASVWPTLSGAVSGAVGAAQGALSGFLGFLGGLAAQAGAAAANIGSSIASGLLSSLGSITAAAGQIAGAIASVLPGSPVAEGPLRVLNNNYAGGQIVEMLASGMQSKESMLADRLVGLLTPVAQASGGSGATFQGGINFYGSSNSNPDALATGLMRRISQIEKRKGQRKY